MKQEVQKASKRTVYHTIPSIVIQKNPFTRPVQKVGYMITVMPCYDMLIALVSRKLLGPQWNMKKLFLRTFASISCRCRGRVAKPISRRHTILSLDIMHTSVAHPAHARVFSRLRGCNNILFTDDRRRFLNPSFFRYRYFARRWKNNTWLRPKEEALGDLEVSTRLTGKDYWEELLTVTSQSLLYCNGYTTVQDRVRI